MRCLPSKYSVVWVLFLAAALGALPAADAEIYVDKVGRRVDIPSCPQRIVSLAPNITETLFALGLDREIVGVTMLSNFPEAARAKPRVGTFINISLERVAALNPDLVIATADGNRKETVVQLERIGIPVYTVNPKSCEEILRMIMDIGRITGRERRAEEVVTDLRRKIGRIASCLEGLERPRVFLQIGGNPIMTVGRDTLHNELIYRAGGVNIYGDTAVRYPRCGIEDIIARKPDIIIISSMKEGEDFLGVGRGWGKWESIPAVGTGKIYIIDADLIDQASPRIVDGLERMVTLIHPEVTWNKR